LNLALWKMMGWKSVGMMIIPNMMGKIYPNVPNHQPANCSVWLPEEDYIPQKSDRTCSGTAQKTNQGAQVFLLSFKG
jgi:hypothetical protein